MITVFRKISSVLFACSTALALLVYPLPSKAAVAAADYYMITVSQLSGTICLGDRKALAVIWSPLNSSGSLAPLSGPVAIIAKARKGSLDRYTIRPDSVSGISSLEYTADAEGLERIDVQAFSTSEHGDAVDHIEFEVKKCSYRFTLSAHLFDDIAGADIQMSIDYSWVAKGTLKPSDLTNTRTVEAKDKVLKLTETITSYSLPGCTYSSSVPATGIAHVDARAFPGSGTKGIVLQLSPPKDASIDFGVKVFCKEKTTNIDSSFPISITKDPWIEVTFPEGQGTLNVPIDYFQETVDNVNSAPGHRASYTATLTLERVEE